MEVVHSHDTDNAKELFLLGEESQAGIITVGCFSDRCRFRFVIDVRYDKFRLQYLQVATLLPDFSK